MNFKITPLIDTLRLEKISDEEYFSEQYDNYISNSRLSLINPEQDNNPQAFFEGLGKHNKYSDALIFGSAVHELTLQPHLFFLNEEVDRPTSKAGFMADELYKIHKSNKEITDDHIIQASDKIGYYKGSMTQNRINELRAKCEDYWDTRLKWEKQYDGDLTPIFLDPKSRERVNACINALKENQKIQSLLHPSGLVKDPISENELAILLDVQIECENSKPFILRLKAKLDNFTIDTETGVIVVNDVKTIGKILSYFEDNFEKFRYYRELAIYTWLLSLCAKKFYGVDKCTIKSNCLVVSTIPDYYTKVYEVTKGDLAKGWCEFRNLLNLISQYVITDYKNFAIWT